jgi:hypothetical protein
VAAPDARAVQASAAELGFTGASLPLSAAQLSVVQVMAATKAAEDALLGLCSERDALEQELAKLPLGSGRTMQQRQRKACITARLAELGPEISRLRTGIKRLNGDTRC